MVGVQLPDGASLERTQSGAGRRSPRSPAPCPAWIRWSRSRGISVAGQQRDAGQRRRRLRHPEGLERERQGRPARSSEASCRRRWTSCRTAAGFVIPPPPIQGIGNAGGFTMQVELRDGSFDYAKLQAISRRRWSPTAPASRAAARSTRRSAPSVPQLQVEVDRVKAETLKVSVGDVFNALAGYIGSSYVNQFNKFGRTFQVYVQADSQFRLRPQRHRAALRAQPGRPDGAAGRAGDDSARGRAVADLACTICIRPRPSSADRRRASAPARRCR